LSRSDLKLALQAIWLHGLGGCQYLLGWIENAEGVVLRLGLIRRGRVVRSLKEANTLVNDCVVRVGKLSGSDPRLRSKRYLVVVGCLSIPRLGGRVLEVSLARLGGELLDQTRTSCSQPEGSEHFDVRCCQYGSETFSEERHRSSCLEAWVGWRDLCFRDRRGS